MRIVSGKFGGRKIKVLDSKELRPTSEKVREAIFSSLFSLTELSGRHILDLYAGTGALGLEALSRGAENVTFVEKNRRHATTLRSTLEELGLDGMSELIPLGVEDFFSEEIVEPIFSPFDVIFADPPYRLEVSQNWFEALVKCRYIAPNAFFVFETSSEVISDIETIETSSGNIRLLKSKIYGDTLVRYYTLEKSIT